MTVTLINPFVIPTEREEEMLCIWKESSARLAKMPGFIETRLHRNTGEEDKTFLFINIALWESVEAYHAAFKDAPPDPPELALAGVKYYSGLFQPILTLKKES
jgi:heme-degrading monooxygenase HmoA